MTGRPFRFAVPLAAAAIVIGASVASGALDGNFTNREAPVPGQGTLGYLKMTGATTGTFVGDVNTRGHAGAIGVLALDLGLTRPVDEGGRVLGRERCDAVSFRKRTDRSTPQLFHAEATNETITSAVFDQVSPGTPNAPSATVLTVDLTNAVISSIHHVDATTTGAYEDVTLIPQKMTVTWTAGGIASSVECLPQVP